jgi:hypothetical protein
MCHTSTPDQDFLSEVRQCSYGTILADPPWQFSNRTGKMAPEHRRLSRYPTLTLQAIKAIELVLFGVRGQLRTRMSGRTQVNIIRTRKREHSRKPHELYAIIEACSPGPFLELFARGQRADWDQWGNEVVDYTPSWPTYANHSQHWERQRA